MDDSTPGKPLRAYDGDGNWRDLSTDELVGARLNGYRGWTCAIGVDNLFINPDGNVYGGACEVGGKLGNIYGDFSIPDAWSTCSKLLCTCGSDLFIPKARTPYETNLLRKSKNLPTQTNRRRNRISEMAALERTHSAGVKQIYWEIGRRCNYDCGYCCPSIHNNHERHKTLDELLTATKLLQQRFIGVGGCNWIISGGEPTANGAFLDWCRYISSCGYHLSMHSNGSRKPDYYRELIRYGNLNLSAHYQFWNPDKFIDVVAAVTEAKAAADNAGMGHLEVKLMMTPGSRQTTLDFEERLKAIPRFTEYCTWAIVPVRDGDRDDAVLDGYDEVDFALFGDRLDGR